MSFGYAVGDVVAVLGLFERVAIELRNYNNAPSHFQQLSAELDLLRNTLQHVLRLNAENQFERETLERIRAIAIHCLQPLQTLADKMQVKEGSLGHFRTIRSLNTIGTRLHWSMIAQKDVDELRKVILSEMVAINILLGVQQLGYIRHMSAIMRDHNSQISTQLDAHSDTLIKQASKILEFVSTTPDAVAGIHHVMTAQAKQQSQQAQSLTQSLNGVISQLNVLSLDTSATTVTIRKHANYIKHTATKLCSFIRDIQKLLIFLSTCTKELLEAISRNTRMLLNVANQMKRIAQSIEAIPLHLDLPIVRLDDALGESWGLPFQACGTWQSFTNLLQQVIFTNGRAGTNRVATGQFVITLSKTGKRIDYWNWEREIRSGMHIEQAMMIESFNSSNEKCSKPGCPGSTTRDVGKNHGKACSICGQLVILSKRFKPILDLPLIGGLPPGEANATHQHKSQVSTDHSHFPQMQLPDEIQHFRRVQIYEPIEHIDDIEEAFDRLRKDKQDPAANRRIGLHFLQVAEGGIASPPVEDSIPFLQAAFPEGGYSDAETWYLLGRAHLYFNNHEAAYNAFQNATYQNGSCPSYWISIGVLYFEINQYRDSLDSLMRALRLNPYMWEAWFSLGVLYEYYQQTEDARKSYWKCLELNPDLPDVRARIQVINDHQAKNVPDDHRIYHMRQCELRILGEMRAVKGGADIIINPIRSFDMQSTRVGETDEPWDSTSEDSERWKGWEDAIDEAEDWLSLSG